MVAPIDGRVPDPASYDDPAEREAVERALALHGPRARHAARARSPSTASSSARARTRGSRTCAPRRPSSNGHSVAPTVRAMVVPGSAKVKRAGRGGGPRPGLHERRLRVARGGLLDVPRHEPRHPRRRRALRLDLEPQLRGPPGRAAGARTSSARRWPPPPRSRGHFIDVRELGSEGRSRTQVTGRVAVLDRADVDTDQIIPKQFLKRIERSGYGEFLFFDWMKDPEFELRRPGVRGRVDPRRRAQLRLRLLARARGVGARGLRLPDRARAELRRHLLVERDQERDRADRARRGRARRRSRKRSRPRTSSPSTSRRSRSRTRRPARSRSSSTRSRGTCS